MCFEVPHIVNVFDHYALKSLNIDVNSRAVEALILNWAGKFLQGPLRLGLEGNGPRVVSRGE